MILGDIIREYRNKNGMSMDAFSKKGNSYYDEDEYYDVPYDFEYTEEIRRANWYDSNFEEIRSKVDT